MSAESAAGRPLPARRGDEEELFRLHHHQLVRLVQGRLGVTRELAEDAAGLAWVQLLRRQPERGRIIGWLYTVAKHEAFALIGKRRRETPGEELHEVICCFDLDGVVEARRALRALDRLKPQQQVVLRLRIEGLSYDEIAEATGRTLTWVNRHIAEGRQALRRLLDEE
jgi:RNA polymerase sigma-70 factor (ECF subfamily)